jgi:hypothetical protein
MTGNDKSRTNVQVDLAYFRVLVGLRKTIKISVRWLISKLTSEYKAGVPIAIQGS